MTTSQQDTGAGGVDSPTAAGGTAAAYAGLQDRDVQDLYDAVGRVVEKQLGTLRRLQHDAESRLRLAAVEQQQLDRFLDEVEYRMRFQEGASPPGLPVGSTLAAQQGSLKERQATLRQAQTRLEHLHSRIGWLIRQIELSAQRVEERADDPAETDPWGLLLRAQLIQGQEAERSRLAREIHDGPAQALTNTLLRLQLLESVLQSRPVDAAQELALVRGSVRESLQDVRRFIFNLRPASLKEVGLVGTLHRLISDYREYGEIEIQATLPESMGLTPEQELVVFRVVQEALHNIRKHAGASRVDVEVARLPSGWRITIVDDGRGFALTDLPSRPQTGSGLLSIRERAAIVGGSLQISSAPGQGTRTTLTIPPGSPAPPAAAGAHNTPGNTPGG